MIHIDDELIGIDSPDLLKFLETHTTIEHIGLFARGIQILREYNHDDIEDLAEEQIFTSEADIKEPADAIMELDALVNNRIIDLLGEMLIKVDPEISLLRSVPILESMRMLEDTELAEEVLAVLDSGGTPIDQLLDCLSIAGLSNSNDYFSDVWQVDHETILKLHTIIKARYAAMEETQSEEQTLSPAYREIIDQIKRFNTYLKTDKTRFMNTIRNGLALDLPFDTYTSYYSDLFNGLEDINVSVELLGFFFMSSERKEDPVTVITPLLESLVDGTERAQRILRNIRHITSRFAQITALES